MLIDVTDGGPWTYEREYKEVDYAVEMAKRIMAYDTPNGHPLLFHAHIGMGQPKYICPGPDTALRGRQAKLLYEISSEIPESYRAIASKYDIHLANGARGFISNSDPITLIKFVNFGSSAVSLDRMSA